MWRMDKQRTSTAPLFVAIIALVVVLLLYVGSYLALVNPPPDFAFGSRMPNSHYRAGGKWAERIFWPLEQIDRKVRPGAWFNRRIMEMPSLNLSP